MLAYVDRCKLCTCKYYGFLNFVKMSKTGFCKRVVFEEGVKKGSFSVKIRFLVKMASVSQLQDGVGLPASLAFDSVPPEPFGRVQGVEKSEKVVFLGSKKVKKS